jgi:hypothetical protein
MKKLFLICIVLILTSGFIFGQKLKKGNLIGTHVLTIELNAGVTMEQFLDFYMGTLLPEYEKHLKGWKFYMTKGIRGENENNYGWIGVIESEETRAKYLDNEELWEAINEKLKPTTEELDKLGKVTEKYTDWLVL